MADPPEYDPEEEGEDVKLLRQWIDEERREREHRERMAARNETDYQRTLRLMTAEYRKIEDSWRNRR
jgi:hypothetical protein